MGRVFSLGLNLTANGPTEPASTEGDASIRWAAAGDFGNGVLALQFSLDGTTWNDVGSAMGSGNNPPPFVEIQELEEAGVREVNLPACFVRLNLTGANNPDLNVVASIGIDSR